MVFPDRLIYPLPKRRLRERLSPNVADSIQFPPAHVSGSPFFYYPYSLKDDVPAALERANVLNHRRTATTPPGTALYPDASNSLQVRRDSDGDGPLNSSRVVRLVNRISRHQPTLIPSPPDSQQAAPSAASSVDGYDSFENTNNKKKRKIPTAGDASHAGSYTSTDIHSVSSGPLSTTTNDDTLSGGSLSSAYSGSASFVAAAPGISGPGRGRYGRNRNGRKPLRPLPEAGSNWSGRNGKSQPPWPTPLEADRMPTHSTSTGIISNAIANAEKQASREQENTTHVREQPSVMSSPASAQFTFTCTSQVPGNLMWPGSDPKIPTGSSQWQQGRLRGGHGQPGSEGGRDKSLDRSDEPDAAGRSLRGSDGSEAKLSEKAALKKLDRELAKQARERKRIQQRQNAVTSPSSEFYICPFCEYESFYKKKPKSFIRSFELRERKKREQAEERQRLLDKAKARGRKGKKAARAATSSKTGSSTDSQAQGGRVSDELPDDVPNGEGFYEIDDDGGEEDVYGGVLDSLLPVLDGGGTTNSKKLSGGCTLRLQAIHIPDHYCKPFVS
ncbi:hypothetical protein CMQ_4961 [Grosmannia clavigera kw1407]|uniref:Uncharacterized protein n=1 Tax=Grosmannia clavigera (strain kw1407 / UAMH 11150) TaxID=655863 RepID=F0XK42_GROCL|nr:uncharacterized protein CMQ_4961 [Grosmannia clavigera kw1407]EFX01890.1 hypothetical protein CMQ_4961 [Grosmannia clavigera kw1407]